MGFISIHKKRGNRMKKNLLIAGVCIVSCLVLKWLVCNFDIGTKPMAPAQNFITEQVEI